VPELPEVETIRRLVERHLVGRRITDVDLRLPKLMRDSPCPDLSVIAGQTIAAARRQAKVLVLDLSNGWSLLVHFKLSGQLAIERPDGSRDVAGHPVPDPTGPFPHKATHLELRFDDGTIVWYSDIRQFSWLRLMPTGDVEAALTAFGFGPEALDEAVVLWALKAVAPRRRIPIKTVLLDQTVIAGLGNIYADEALFAAGIHPGTPANEVSRPRLAKLARSIPWALEQGLAQGGAKIVNNKARPIDGFPAVHGRQGEPCFTCGTTVEKIRVGARGTYFCPTCQNPRLKKHV
jgi:formamidopyrimidine-DNA glycosylase